MPCHDCDSDKDVVANDGHEPLYRLRRGALATFLNAATIVAEVWDVGRFPSANHLASWAGLTPTE